MRWKIVNAKPQEKKFCVRAMISELSWRQISTNFSCKHSRSEHVIEEISKPAVPLVKVLWWMIIVINIHDYVINN